MTEPLFCLSRSTVCGRDPQLHCIPRQLQAPAGDCPDGLPILIQVLGDQLPLAPPEAPAPSAAAEPQKPTITAGLLIGLAVLAALVTAASTLGWAVVRVGIHFSFERVGFTPDDLGGRGNLLAGSLGAGCGMIAAAAIVAAAVFLVVKAVRGERRVRRHDFGGMSGQSAAWCLIGLLTAALSTALLVVEESRTIGLTLRDPAGNASRVFLGGYVMAAGMAAGLLIFCVVAYLKPAAFEPTAVQLMRLKVRARDHVAGMSAIAGMLLAIFMLALSLVASAAVTVQLRAGHAPGFVGTWLGADVECVQLSWASTSDAYVLYVGRTDKQSLFLQDGHTVLRLAEQDITRMDKAPNSKCWLPPTAP